MRILVTIPNYFRNDPNRSKYGSCKADPQPRVAALTASLAWLHQTFGSAGTSAMVHSDHPYGGLPANEGLSNQLDVVVCTTGDAHLLGSVPAGLCQHVQTSAEPMLLGYECHALLRDALGRYDWYVFLEDDLLIMDPLFFAKLGWFVNLAGEDATLMPNRFERHASRPGFKLYIDGQTSNPAVSAHYQDRMDRPEVTGRMFDQNVSFKRVDNVHGGAFFLTEAQMRRFAAAPHFLDRSENFWSGLESAATLGIMRSFRVYKPARRNAAFLEMLHAHNRELRL